MPTMAEPRTMALALVIGNDLPTTAERLLARADGLEVKNDVIDLMLVKQVEQITLGVASLYNLFDCYSANEPALVTPDYWDMNKLQSVFDTQGYWYRNVRTESWDHVCIVVHIHMRRLDTLLECLKKGEHNEELVQFAHAFLIRLAEHGL